MASLKTMMQHSSLPTPPYLIAAATNYYVPAVTTNQTIMIVQTTNYYVPAVTTYYQTNMMIVPMIYTPATTNYETKMIADPTNNYTPAAEANQTNNVVLEKEKEKKKKKKKKAVYEKLLKEKKLTLVLDLDQTLLHSIKFSDLSKEDQCLISKAIASGKLKDSLFRVEVMDSVWITKLRPGVERFLEESSKLFNLHLFTKGSRDYAMEMVKLIDPKNVYFGCNSLASCRVLTRGSPVDKKRLDLVMAKKRGILIVDDEDMVWRDVDKDNVMKIPKYEFFASSEHGLKLSILRELCEPNGWLETYLTFLEMIHARFFDPNGGGDGDVRPLKNNLVEYFELLNMSKFC